MPITLYKTLEGAESLSQVSIFGLQTALGKLGPFFPRRQCASRAQVSKMLYGRLPTVAQNPALSAGRPWIRALPLDFPTQSPAKIGLQEESPETY